MHLTSRRDEHSTPKATLTERRTVVDGPTAEIAVLSIRGLGAAPTDASYTPLPQFVFPLDGVHLLADGRTELLVDMNHAAVIPGLSTTRDRHPSRGDMSCLIVTPTPDILEEAGANRQAVWNQSCFSRPFSAQAQMSACLAASEGDTCRSEELALELVRTMLDAAPSPAAVAGGRRLRLIRDVKELLAENLHPISLSEAAAQVGVTASYLTTLFHELEGMPLYRYHTRLRLAEALRRLIGCEDITALALDLGFSSHSHFTSAFRSAFGLTPSQFRAETRGASRGWTGARRLSAHSGA